MNNKVLYVETIFDIISTEVIEDLSNRIIYREIDGSYVIFNKFYLRDTTLYTLSNDVIHNFYNVKNALIYCSFDKRNRFLECNKLLDLDRRLSNVMNDILLHLKIIKNKTADIDIYKMKLEEDLILKDHIKSKLHLYYHDVNHWYRKKLNYNN